MNDIVRVLRIIEYIGPRDVVEVQLNRSVHGTKVFGAFGREITINVATIGQFPEILEKACAERKDA